MDYYTQQKWIHRLAWMALGATIAVFTLPLFPSTAREFIDRGQSRVVSFASNTPLDSRTVATVEDINTLFFSEDLFVVLKPTKNAIAEKEYTVELYENDRFRTTTRVKWNASELNIQKTLTVSFPLSYEERSAYSGVDSNKLRSVFSARVVE